MVRELFVVNGDHNSCCRPSYCSYKSLEKSYNLEFWLQYWTIFGLLSVLEHVLSPLVRIIPLYSFFKLLFITWMQIPQTMVRHSERLAASQPSELVLFSQHDHYRHPQESTLIACVSFHFV